MTAGYRRTVRALRTSCWFRTGLRGAACNAPKDDPRHYAERDHPRFAASQRWSSHRFVPWAEVGDRSCDVCHIRTEALFSGLCSACDSERPPDVEARA